VPQSAHVPPAAVAVSFLVFARNPLRFVAEPTRNSIAVFIRDNSESNNSRRCDDWRTFRASYFRHSFYFERIVGCFSVYMPVRIHSLERIVPHISIEIEALWIVEIGIGTGSSLSSFADSPAT